MILETIPVDSALPALEALRHPELRIALLIPVLKGEALLRAEYDVIRHVPGKRCLLQLTLTTRRGNTRLLAKTFSKGRGSRMDEASRELFAAGFGTGPYLVCEPMGYDASTDTCFFSLGEGQPLAELIVSGAAAADDFERAGAWLRKLHTSGVTAGRKYDFSRHLYTLGLQGAALSPELSEIFSTVLRAMREKTNLLAGASTGPTHRDFSPHHLLFGAGLVTGIDLDEFCQYYPLFDVVHFLAHLRLMALYEARIAEGLDEYAAAFLSGYGRSAVNRPEYDFLAAVAFLKTAHIAGAVHRRHDGREAALVMLKEAQICIGKC